MSAERLAVMVNGVPGRMATAVAEAAVRRGLDLAEEALTGPETAGSKLEVEGKAVTLVGPDGHGASLARMAAAHPRLIAVDYTQPAAATGNAERYATAGVPFVMGTTGGDEAAMRAAAKQAGVRAVIAPNMGKQVVAFQAMLELMAAEFPGAFAGYTLKVKESHQATKVDTSGTAKAVIRSFNGLGVPYDVSAVDKVRDAHRSMQEMGVPGQHVTAGHAFHTYRLESAGGDVAFEFQHNVCGRTLYAEGTVDAVLFLDAQVRGGSDKLTFDMIDILRERQMSG